jgi:hypothetical protein
LIFILFLVLNATFSVISWRPVLVALYITKKGALDSQLQVINFSSLLAHGRWFSPGIPASSTTKTGRHDIAEILLKVAHTHVY